MAPRAPNTMIWALVDVALASAAALALMGWDKSRGARRTGRRVPERTLLLCALLGGSPGAYAGRWLFRHKTRKQPFVARLHWIAAGQGFLLVVALVRWWIG